MSLRRSLLALSLIPAAAHAQTTAQLDPQGSGAILGAVTWLQGTLLGNVATAIAVVMLIISFLLLLAINALQRWSNAGRVR